MGLQRAFGWFCGTEPVQIAAALQAGGVNAISTGPAIFQATGSSTNPGAEYSYPTSSGATAVRPAFDPTLSVASLRQIRAAGKTAVLKMLFYSQDSTACTNLDPGSEAAAVTWCENYFATVLSPFLDPSLPSGAEFDVLNVETELNQITGPYPAAWKALLQQIRSAGFTGILTSSANDPSLTTTPWAAYLDWFGYDYYPGLTNTAYTADYPGAGNVSDPAALARYYARVLPLPQISAQFEGIPVYLGEFGFGFGPNGGDSSPVAWTDAEFTTMVEVLIDVMDPMDCWAGMSIFNWPYSNPDGTANYPNPALGAALAAGWTSSVEGPDFPAASQVGPRNITRSVATEAFGASRGLAAGPGYFTAGRNWLLRPRRSRSRTLNRSAMAECAM